MGIPGSILPRSGVVKTLIDLAQRPALDKDLACALSSSDVRLANDANIGLAVSGSGSDGRGGGANGGIAVIIRHRLQRAGGAQRAGAMAALVTLAAGT